MANPLINGRRRSWEVPLSERNFGAPSPSRVDNFTPETRITFSHPADLLGGETWISALNDWIDHVHTRETTQSVTVPFDGRVPPVVATSATTTGAFRPYFLPDEEFSPVKTLEEYIGHCANGGSNGHISMLAFSLMKIGLNPMSQSSSRIMVNASYGAGMERFHRHFPSDGRTFREAFSNASAINSACTLFCLLSHPRDNYPPSYVMDQFIRADFNHGCFTAGPKGLHVKLDAVTCMVMDGLLLFNGSLWKITPEMAIRGFIPKCMRISNDDMTWAFGKSISKGAIPPSLKEELRRQAEASVVNVQAGVAEDSAVLNEAQVTLPNGRTVTMRAPKKPSGPVNFVFD